MPIVNEEGRTYLEFGHGDIEIAPGLVNGEYGCVCFFHQEEIRPIGERSVHVPGKEVPAEETPVRMVFLKEASIDVLIRALMDAKRLMIHKDVVVNLPVEDEETWLKKHSPSK
jgi:hypothetical protein